MPLSEHEQRLLDEMERSLYQSDADHVAHIGGLKGRPQSRSIVIGALVVVAGVVALVVGVSLQIPVLGTIIGIIGFVAMFCGVLLAVTPSRGFHRIRPEDLNSRTTRTHAGAQQGFMDKLNDRWDKRGNS